MSLYRAQLRCRSPALTDLFTEVKVALLQQAEELLDGRDRGSFHVHQCFVVTLGLSRSPERLQTNDCVHLLPAGQGNKKKGSVSCVRVYCVCVCV